MLELRMEEHSRIVVYTYLLIPTDVRLLLLAHF